MGARYRLLSAVSLWFLHLGYDPAPSGGVLSFNKIIMSLLGSRMSTLQDKIAAQAVEKEEKVLEAEAKEEAKLKKVED